MLRQIKRGSIVAGALSVLVLNGCSGVAATPTPTSVGTSATKESASSAGVLVPKATTVDLGNVPFDVPAQGQFELVNTGSQPVKLLGAPEVKMLEGC
jgi:hypothetical protein